MSVCLACKKSNIVTLIKRTGGNTSGMKKHLASEHLKIYEKIFGVKSSVPESGQLKISDMCLPVRLLFGKLEVDTFGEQIIRLHYVTH